MIDVQGVQHRKSSQMVTLPDINPVQQGLTSVNKREPVFPFTLAVHGAGIWSVSVGQTNYEQCVHLGRVSE